MNSDNIDISNNWFLASKKRQAIASFVDFLLFSATLGLVCWVLAKADPTLAVAPLWIQLTLFLIVEVLFIKVISWSPGHWALGIHQRAEPGRSTTAVVSPATTNAERWWTILLGVLIVLEGTKMAVRWTLWHTPIPFMGYQLQSITSAIVSVVMGGLLCLIGLFVLRCRPMAAMLGVALYILALLSSVLSYDLWSFWVAADVVARREYQGLSVREGEVEAMQRWAPTLVVAGPALMLMWLIAASRKFLRVG